MRPFLLYHWSPAKNRRGILRRGIEPGRLSRGKEWRAPYSCWCRHPNTAWGLSATYGPRWMDWDLWCCWSDRIARDCLKTVNVHGGDRWWMTEYRVSVRVPKSKLWYVGRRQFVSRRHS